MNSHYTLNNRQRTELIGLLCSYPPLKTRDGRDVWLMHLPPSVRDLIIRRHDNCKIDLAFIIDAIESQQLADGTWPLLILTDALLPETENLAVGKKLEALRQEISALLSPAKVPSDVIGDLNPGLDLPPSFEEIIIGRDEKVLISFLRNGLEAAKSVARIIVPRTIGGQVSGTGWLVTPDLLLTCYHVVEARRQGQEPPTTSQELEQQAKASILWFGYEVGAYTEYRCIDLAHSCKALDYALLRIAQTSVNGVSLSDWGILKLARIQPNLLRGTRLNVIQHPGGRVKEIALRTNFYIGSVAESSRLHYLSDTEKGSSGSPVLDDTWQAVALHRAWDYYDRYYEGQPVIRFSSLGLQYAGLNEFSGQAVATINEGVLIHSILDDLPGSVREEIEHAQQW
jgi:V8-like Glu-specific endopeptidase